MFSTRLSQKVTTHPSKEASVLQETVGKSDYPDPHLLPKRAFSRRLLKNCKIIPAFRTKQHYPYSAQWTRTISAKSCAPLAFRTGRKRKFTCIGMSNNTTLPAFCTLDMHDLRRGLRGNAHCLHSAHSTCMISTKGCAGMHIACIPRTQPARSPQRAAWECICLHSVQSTCATSGKRCAGMWENATLVAVCAPIHARSSERVDVPLSVGATSTLPWAIGPISGLG